MNDLNVVVKNGVNLFSSRLIAEATGKEHSNVVRDIKNMLESLGLYDFHPSNLKDDDFKGFFINYKDYQGRKVVDEILLDKQLTMCLVTGYDVKQRMRVIKRVDELEEQIKQLAAPQQQTQLIPGTPEHFTKYMTEALTQAYRSYFGEPVQTALPVQQQHTEPVEALPPTVGVHNPCPANKISLNKMKNYVSNETLLKELINGFGLVGELFDPGCVEGTNKAARPYMVYNKNQVAAMLKAAQVLADKVEGGKRRLLGRTFSVKTNVAPHLYDGFDFDAACEMILLLKAKQC